MSNYESDIIIESNSTLQNVTLYLPVPVFEDKSEVGLEMVNGDYYNKPSSLNPGPRILKISGESA